MTLQANILVIEDRPFESGSLALVVQQEGYCVTAVGNGLAALTQLESQKYDVVISGLKMPHMTGIGLIREIKSGNMDSEVILVIAYGDLKGAVSAIKAEAMIS